MDRMSQPIYLVSLYNEIMVVATKVMMVAVVEWWWWWECDFKTKNQIHKSSFLDFENECKIVLKLS